MDDNNVVLVHLAIFIQDSRHLNIDFLVGFSGYEPLPKSIDALVFHMKIGCFHVTIYVNLKHENHLGF